MTSTRNNPEKLQCLLEEARTHGWTREERTAQIISFAHSNVKLHNPAINRADVERAYEQLTQERT